MWRIRYIGIVPAVFVLAITARAGDAAPPVASFTVRADWFDRGNVQVSRPGQAYADRFACIWNAGQLPNQTEYDIDFPVTARYTLVALYAAANARPVDIYLDGQKVHTGFSGVTGSWQTATARWETQRQLRISQGRHTVRLICPGPCMPHICALRFESPVPFPATWKLDRPAARQRQAAVEPVPQLGHLVPELPLLTTDADRLRIEVMRADQAELLAAQRHHQRHNELLQSPSRAAASPRTPWIARLSLRATRGDGPTSELNLSPPRLQEMLGRTEAMIADFRTQKGADPALLERERELVAELRGQLAGLLEEEDGRDKWQRFGQAYLAAAQLQRRVALRNPLLDFEQLLVIKRGVNGPALGLPQNWQGNCALPTTGFDDEIAILDLSRPAGSLKTLYRPEGPHFVGDMDLHFDGNRLLFSSIGELDKWHVFEIYTDGTRLRQLTPSLPDVHHYDACYLPDGAILFGSTASMAAVPCVNGSSRVANLYRMEPDGTIRQLCFDQEHNWCPTVQESGRVMYLRWEYTDTPHSHDRVLFSMNPDGTQQMEFYGSNSYWPNSLFYARPIPDRPSMFVGIVGGHHGVPRMGELVLFDTRRGRREASGAVQRIPGAGQEVRSATDPRYGSTLIEDNLVDDSWPKFLHPYPLSEKYFLVACQPTAESLWGIYLADTKDNLVLVREMPGYALLEPVPLRGREKPPVIPDTVDPQRRDAVVFLSDIYAGPGLQGIPRGEVKRLRLFSYHYLFPGMGGPQGVVGMEGPWDIKRILGTVPVRPDGSACFRIPSNTPIAVQPLDAEGKALQLMRSWFTGMPGEVVSCVGCHESQSSSPPPTAARAALREPDEIEPWYGPTRGFNFEREVQPVLDRYCVACHNGRTTDDGRQVADLRGLEQITDYTSVYHYGGDDAGHFSTSYVELHRFVRRPGLESDYHLLMPMEFHADTTQLVQLLQKGHHGVQLDAPSWDRLITWIDLNAPYHGTWTEIAGRERVAPLARRRRELLKLYAGVDRDPEAEADAPPRVKPKPIVPEPVVSRAMPGIQYTSAPLDDRPPPSTDMPVRVIPLGDGVTIRLVRLPAGELIMGDGNGEGDEQPRHIVRMEKPFWIGCLEITNRQYRLFDPSHDSRVESRFAMQFGVRGFYVNAPDQPVVRVSWQRAMDFCDWLSERTGQTFSLPTEAQWEYACRAGTDTAFSFGHVAVDFSPFANLADATLSEFVCHPYKKNREPYANPSKYDDWIPKEGRFNDGGFLSEKGGNYRANAWGLFDMHGNVAEWTRSLYHSYPYRADDGRNDREAEGRRVVRGGSWRDRPHRARSGFRLAYRPYQAVYNVGFRVVCEDR